MSTLSEQIRQQIEENGVPQRAKWKFWLENTLKMFFLLLFSALGLISWAFLWFFAFHVEIFSFLMASPRTGLRLLVLGLPSLWILLFLVGITLGTVLWKRTPRGYRHSWAFWGLFLLIFQIFGGFLLQMGRFPARFEPKVAKLTPFYQKIDGRRPDFYAKPHEGVLIGRVNRVLDEKVIVFDPKRRRWEVLGLKNPKKSLKKGDFVRIEGEISKKGEFLAEKVKKMPKKWLKE